jgi:hypothetical protein
MGGAGVQAELRGGAGGAWYAVETPAHEARLTVHTGHAYL